MKVQAGVKERMGLASESRVRYVKGEMWPRSAGTLLATPNSDTITT